MRRLLLPQATEAHFIKEDELRPNWNPAELARWQQAVARLDSLRQEMAALTAGAPAGSARQEHPSVRSVTEEPGRPDIMQQGAPVVAPGSLENGPSPSGCQPDDEATSMPAGTEAEMLTEGCAAEVQPAEDELGPVQPVANHQKSREGQHLPEAEAAQATEPLAGSTAREALCEGGQSAEPEVRDMADPDNAITLSAPPQVPDAWARHDWGVAADSRVLIEAVRLRNSDEVERLLSVGYNVTIQDAGGHMALRIAAESGQLT